MKKFTKYLYVVMMLLFFGCNQNEVISPELDQKISVKEVKNYLSNSRKNIPSARINKLNLDFDHPVFADSSLFFPLFGLDSLYLSTPGTAKAIKANSGGFAYAYKQGDQVSVELLLPYATSNEKDFTGYYISTDYLTGQTRRIYKFESGNFIGEYAVENNADKDEYNSGRTQGFYCIETTVVLFTKFSYTLEGIHTEIHSIQSISSHEDCFYESNGTADYTEPVREIESGGAGGKEVETICSAPFVSDGKGGCIINSLDDPCLREVADLALNTNLEDDFTAIIQDAFNTSDDVNLIISDDYEFTGIAVGRADIDMRWTGVIDVTIFLNADRLPNTTQELIASTIYHEAFHALFRYFDINKDYQSTPDDHHINLFNNYVQALANSMTGIFPMLSNRDAKGLILKGLLAYEDKDGWGELYTYILAMNNFTTEDLESLKNDYIDGKLGTVCN